MLRFVSVRWKIAALLFAVVVAITGLDAWLVPERAADAERAALIQRARAAAAMLADSSSTAVDLASASPEYASQARDALRVGLADPLVEFAAVYDADGRRLGEHHRTSTSMIPATLRAESDARDLRVAEDLIIVAAPVTSRMGLIGTVAVGLRSAMIAEQRAGTRQTIAIQGVSVALIGLIVSFFLATRMTRQITEMAGVAGQIARGDVSSKLQLMASGDELGEMARTFESMNDQLRLLQQGAVRVASGDLTGTISGEGELFVAFRRMLENLRGLSQRVGSSSDAVGSAAAGMFSAVREQETLATQQTASLEEIRRTLETLVEAAEDVARDAASVREMAGRTAESSQRMAEQTRLVSAHSDRIGEILSLIQDIADRSDLLALNAALEGTKAGEVGRGFSLVAAEMRRLSEHVMDSVRDIRKLVADMRAASHASVLATEESTKLARDAAGAAAAISEAMRRHQQGTNQAKTAADEVVRAVNESLTGSAATTRSAEALLQLSHELRQATAAFRVSENDQSHS
jgi:methyl-accepting chemotaxis protein